MAPPFSSSATRARRCPRRPPKQQFPSFNFFGTPGVVQPSEGAPSQFASQSAPATSGQGSGSAGNHFLKLVPFSSRQWRRRQRRRRQRRRRRRRRRWAVRQTHAPTVTVNGKTAVARHRSHQHRLQLAASGRGSGRQNQATELTLSDATGDRVVVCKRPEGHARRDRGHDDRLPAGPLREADWSARSPARR